MSENQKKNKNSSSVSLLEVFLDYEILLPIRYIMSGSLFCRIKKGAIRLRILLYISNFLVLHHLCLCMQHLLQ